MTISNDRLRLVVIAGLLTIAAVNLASGFYWLFSPEGGGDLRLRWQEQQYVLRHKNPFDVHAGWRAEQESQPDDEPAQSEVVDADLGVPMPGYPPWSYGTGIAFMWSMDPLVGVISLAAINLACLVCMAFWSYRSGGGRGGLALIFPAASLATDSLNATIALGQLGIIVVGSLLAAYWCGERDRPVLAGLLLGVALIKPTLSVPFLLAFLIKRRWLTLAIAFAYTGLASVIVWALVRTDPVAMLLQMQTAALDWGTIHYTGVADPIIMLTELGVGSKLALQVTPVLSLTIAFILMWIWRRASMMTLMAIAALTARLWVGHHHYDDVIVLFILFGLAENLVKRFSLGAAVAYGVLGFSLIIPGFLHQGLMWDHISWRFDSVWEYVLVLCQVGSLVVLLACSPRK